MFICLMCGKVRSVNRKIVSGILSVTDFEYSASENVYQTAYKITNNNKINERIIQFRIGRKCLNIERWCFLYKI